MNLKNRVVSIYNKKTSMRLAAEEWTALDDICKREHLKRKQLLEMLEDRKSPQIGRTSFVRLFAITYMHKLVKFASLKTKSYHEYDDVYQTLELIS